MIKMTGKIYIVGIGPGSSEYLTKKAIDTVKMSDYTVGSTRAIELFSDVQNTIPFNVKELPSACGRRMPHPVGQCKRHDISWS